jgi:myo-inositol-1(or 4)-monophosphatase
VAAGVLLIAEAGGRISDFQGNLWKPERGDYLFSNGLVHDRVLKLLQMP